MIVFQGKPRSVFSLDYQVMAADQEVAVITGAWFNEAARFTLGGNLYEMAPEGWFSRNFSLKVNSIVLATAHKKSIFKRKFQVCIEQRELTLVAASPFTRKFNVLEDGRIIGDMAPEHMFTRKCRASFPESLSTASQLFLFWLVILMWRRSDSA